MCAFMGNAVKVPQVIPINHSSILGQHCWSGDLEPSISVSANVLQRVQDDLIAC